MRCMGSPKKSRKKDRRQTLKRCAGGVGWIVAEGVYSLLIRVYSLSPVTLRYQPRWCCLAQARVTVPYIMARMVPRVQMAA